MAQALLHNNLSLFISYSTIPKFQTPPYSTRSLRACHLSYFHAQAKKEDALIEDQSSSNIPYWASINSEIEAHLNRFIQLREPFSVFEPMRRLTFDSPRSMAPALCVAACELVGGHRAQALQAASALHVMHVAAQAHDHLPLTDRPRPKTRCNNPINHVFSPSIELQIGDGLLSFGYELLARLDDPNETIKSDRILQVIIEVSRAMGSQGMVEGQFREIECCQEGCEEGWLTHVYEKKSGGLHACGAACGAILGEANEDEIEKLRKYGLYVGNIQALLNLHMNKDKDVNETIQSLRELALKELEDFDPEKSYTISSFLNVGNT